MFVLSFVYFCYTLTVPFDFHTYHWSLLSSDPNPFWNYAAYAHPHNSLYLLPGEEYLNGRLTGPICVMIAVK